MPQESKGKEKVVMDSLKDYRSQEKQVLKKGQLDFTSNISLVTLRTAVSVERRGRKPHCKEFLRE